MAGFFGFFDFTKEGPGVPKDEPQKRGLFRFLEILGRKFGKLITLNLIYSLASIPAFIIYFFAAGMITAIFFEPITDVETMMGAVVSINMLLAVFMIILFGSGPATAGFTYVIRNFTRGEHAWVLSDFVEHFKKNFLQGMAVFLIDIAALFIMITNINFYWAGVDTAIPAPLKTVMGTVTAVISVLYLMLRLYMYPMLITFDLKVRQLYRNSFLLLMMKLPQSVGIFILTIAIFAGIFYLTAINVLFGIVLVPLILFSFTALMQIMYTYSVILKVMYPSGGKKQNTVETE